MAISERDKERLNLTSPAANDIKLGDIVQALQNAVETLEGKVEALEEA